MNKTVFIVCLLLLPVAANAGALDNINIFFTGVNKFFEEIMTFLKEGLYELLTDYLVFWTKNAIKASLSMTLWSMEIAYTVAQEFMAELGIVDAIAAAFNALDARTYQIAQFFKIPDLIELVISAYGTKFALNFIPVIGGR